jgi:prevent-host-death family protein
MVVTAKQLRFETSRILKKVQQVGSVTVTLRGKPVARLTAMKPQPRRRLVDHPAFGIWAGRKDMDDVEGWLKNIRKPRYKL